MINPSPTPEAKILLSALAENLSEGMEHLAVLATLVQEALSNCDFERAGQSQLRRLQTIDLITQSIESYAAALREVSAFAPPDLSLPAGPRTTALMQAQAIEEKDAPEDGSVIWL